MCRRLTPVTYADALLGLLAELGVVVLVPVLERRAGVELRHGHLLLSRRPRNTTAPPRIGPLGLSRGRVRHPLDYVDREQYCHLPFSMIDAWFDGEWSRRREGPEILGPAAVGDESAPDADLANAPE
jgi:hypothetical protein